MKLELTSREVTVILKALAALPYNQVAATIRKITYQASVQMAEKEGNAK
jgi:hypothetical protein